MGNTVCPFNQFWNGFFFSEMNSSLALVFGPVKFECTYCMLFWTNHLHYSKYNDIMWHVQNCVIYIGLYAPPGGHFLYFGNHCINPHSCWINAVCSFDVKHKYLKQQRNRPFFSHLPLILLQCLCCHQVMYTQWPTHCICICLYYWLSQAVSWTFYLDLRALLTSLHPHPLLIKRYLLILRLIKYV